MSQNEDYLDRDRVSDSGAGEPQEDIAAVPDAGVQRPVEITMEDVYVVRTLNPEFNRDLVVAATARTRAINLANTTQPAEE